MKIVLIIVAFIALIVGAGASFALTARLGDDIEKMDKSLTVLKSTYEAMGETGAGIYDEKIAELEKDESYVSPGTMNLAKILNYGLSIFAIALVVLFFMKNAQLNLIGIVLIVFSFITMFIDPSIEGSKYGPASPRTVGLVIAIAMSICAGALIVANNIRSKAN